MAFWASRMWAPPRELKARWFTFEIFKGIRKAFEKQFPQYAYDPDADGGWVDEDDLLFVEYMALTGRLQETMVDAKDDPKGLTFSDEEKRLAAFIVQYLRQRKDPR